MARNIYLNGEFLPEDKALIPIMDRGLLFADAAYEGLGVLDGKFIDFPVHMARLRRSLGALSIPEPMSESEFKGVLAELVRRDGLAEGFVYLHVTRGTAERDYVYDSTLSPTVFAFTQPQFHQAADGPVKAIAMKSFPDLRWARRDLKTTNLLGQVLAKQAAHEAGAYEALLVAPDGYITEGGATSFFMIKDGTIYVRPVSNNILNGVTRRSMLKVAESGAVKFEERLYTLDEVYGADEAFITGSSSYVEPVGSVDDKPIGNGAPGSITLKLRKTYLELVRNQET